MAKTEAKLISDFCGTKDLLNNADSSPERFYEKNLVCTETHEALSLADNGLVSTGGRTYTFENQVPCFLDPKVLAEHQSSELDWHRKHIARIVNNLDPSYSPDRPFEWPKSCWEWSEKWLNCDTVNSDTRIVCIGGAFADDLPHVKSDYKFNIDHLAHEYVKLLPEILKANTHYIACTSEKMPFRDNYADFVYLRNSLDHVSNPIQTLKEIHRILKPDGRFLLNVYYNSNIINEHESTSINDEFVSKCIEPLFASEHHVSTGGTPGTLMMVCRKKPGGKVSFTQQQIESVGQILSCFHSALYFEKRGKCQLAAFHFSRLLKIEPVFKTDLVRILYSLIRFYGIADHEKFNVLRQIAHSLINYQSTLEAIFDRTMDDYNIERLNDSAKIDLADLLKIIDDPAIIEGWRVLWYLALSEYHAGDKMLAMQIAKDVLQISPSFTEARELLKQIDHKSNCIISHVETTKASVASEQTKGSTNTVADKPTGRNLTGVIFSKDRAMQLQGTIESFLLHCSDSDKLKLFVLYKASDRRNQRQYDRLKGQFANISFIEETDFDQQLLAVMTGCEYTLFMVDDNLFVRDFCLTDAIKNLRDNNDAVGFSLRLGQNITYCYSHDRPQPLPVFEQLDAGVLKFNWTQAEHDFGYPLELSSSLYRSKEILALLEQVRFTNPNTLENIMSTNAGLYAQARPALICYENSVTFCNPVNKVQSVYDNRTGQTHSYPSDKLVDMFEAGYRIDVQRYSNLLPNACHQEVELYFKKAAETVSGLMEESAGVPKFSIVIRNYNNAEYIGDAIQSVLDQTFDDWELIVVDDGSTDNSLEVIGRYLDNNHIRLVRRQDNRGNINALKTGIANVRSRYFGILDSDDRLLPRAVEIMYENHIRHPDCGLIYSQFMYCYADLTYRQTGFCSQIPAGRSALDDNVVGHFRTFKLRDYLKTTGVDENILYAEDVDIAYKMEEVTKLKFVDECLYLYRELPDSICHSVNKVNIAIMSRVKAGINAMKRRCAASVEAGSSQSFGQLFQQAVEEAKQAHEDVRQYFEIIKNLYQSGIINHLPLPPRIADRPIDDIVFWLAVNVDIDFKKLFEFISHSSTDAKKPFISVYTATYNTEKFIAQAIESVLKQTYRNFEFLIIDDGSTDRTGEIVNSYSDERIRYIYKQHENCASATNRAIREARGEYILGVDSDDFIAPDYIEKMVTFAQQHPEIDYFYPAAFSPMDESGNLINCPWNHHDFSDNSTLPAFIFERGFGPIPNPGSLKKKTLFDRVGLYEDVETVEDFVFLCKNALKIKFKRVDDCSRYFYRIRPSSNSHKFKARNQIMAEVLNEMVLTYPPELLYPQIADITDERLRQQTYLKYLVTTFYKHAKGHMVLYGEHFQKYGDCYKLKLLTIEGGEELAGSAGGRSSVDITGDIR